MTTGSLCLTEILKSWKSCSSNSDASQTADSTSASGVALPYFSISRLSSEPALTPIRIDVPRSLAACAICLTWSSNLRMLPGLTRTAAQPASIAAKTYFGWKWMSAITGIWECWRDLRQRVGVVLRRAGDPDDVAAGRGELGDLLERGVDVGGERGGHRLHGDRGVTADQHLADLDLAGLAARGEHGRRGAGHPQGDGGHGLQSRFRCRGRRVALAAAQLSFTGATMSAKISITLTTRITIAIA